ncbi:unnamed protein product, partial [Prorocentrum cordatum]
CPFPPTLSRSAWLGLKGGGRARRDAVPVLARKSAGMAPMSLAAWWEAVRENHVVLCLWHCAHGSAFTLVERVLCLSCACACAWYGVYIKYFYLKHWVPIATDEMLDELNIEFPSTWMEDHFDSLLIAVGAGAMDIILGKEAVRAVLRKDWDQKGGVKGFLSFLASAYAAVLTLVSGVHLAITLYNAKVSMQLKLIAKLACTLLVKLCVIENAMITAKTVLRAGPEKSKDA